MAIDCSVPIVLKIANTLSCSTSCCCERHRLRRVVLVVVDLVDDLPPEDAAVRVHVREVRLRAGQHRLVRGLVPGERAGAADDDLRRRDARRVGAAGAGRGNRERGQECCDDERALHRDTACFSTESASVARPMVIDDPGCTSPR